jgi:DNA-directed RNA polymerase I, II, and III subunit RPABC5
MIIPIRCMNCGSILASKWLWYKERVEQLRKTSNKNNGNLIYMNSEAVPETAENQALNELGLKRYCCRKHMITHVDLLDKI